MAVAVHAVDWDDTLVDAQSQEWLPGAVDALNGWLMHGDRVIVHTCRANWPEGRQSILDKLRQSHLDHPGVTVEGKPQADDYIDNRGVRFTGDWAQTLADVGVGTSPKPAPAGLATTPSRMALHRYAAMSPKRRPTFAKRI